LLFGVKSRRFSLITLIIERMLFYSITRLEIRATNDIFSFIFMHHCINPTVQLFHLPLGSSTEKIYVKTDKYEI